MEHELKEVMKEYIKRVDDVCNNLLVSLNLKNKFDFFEYRSINRLMEFEVNGIEYRMHGIGCIAFNNEMFLNWDFGYRSRWCGIDPYLLSSTLKENNDSRVKYYDGSIIKEACEQAVIDGEMFKKGTRYYFTIPINETYKPNFPSDFDTLIIEHFDLKWIIPRNKIINKFIRKATRVYNEIEKSQNPYTLRFILEGKEIFSILYDDIGYPENAIKVMDEILRSFPEIKDIEER